RVKKSSLARKLFQAAIKRGEVGDTIEELRAAAGLEFDRDIRTLSMGMPGDFEKTERFWMIIEGRFKKARITALAKKKASSYKRLEHRGVAYAEIDGDTEMA